MRLGLITPGFSASESDWCIPALLDLVRELAQRHEVHVFALRYPHAARTYRIHGAAVYALGGATAAGGRRLPLLLAAVMALRRAHRQAPFDVFHGLWADEPGFLAVTAGRLLGVPAVVSLLGGELAALPEIGYGGQLSRINRRLTGHALRGARTVTAGSRSLADLASAFVDPGRLTARPLGVDTRLFCSAQGGERAEGAAPLAGAPKLLHVASLAPVKDQLTLLRAVALVANRHPGVHLHMLGEGPLRSTLETEAQALGLAGRVVFHGEVAHERLPGYYRGADLFVLSSRYESQSLVALEAAACGCPIAGTSVGILPELLPPDALAPPGDAAALAVAIHRLVDQPARLAETGASAQRLVTGRLSLQQTVPALEALYREVVSSPRLT